MSLRIDREKLLKILLALVLINYMLVTIVLRDNVFFKYMRDVLIITLGIMSLRNRLENIKYYYLLVLFIFCVLLSSAGATSVGAAFTTARRYIIPVLIYYIAFRMGRIHTFKKIYNYLYLVFTILSVWGIFQAYVLGDEFLKKIGYPVVFQYGYGREMLDIAFYFGNFGIQRVSSTLANPNVFALILGTFIIVAILNRKFDNNKKSVKCKFVIIVLAYVLTVSRSNFLAAFIVTIVLLYPYIQHKERWVAIFVGVILFAIVIGVVQGQNGIVYNLWNWVQNSFRFTESSAAGRSSRWLSGLYYTLHNPLGLGPGHVGTIALNAGKSGVYLDVENSYLCLALDTGWLGAISYYAFLFCKINQFGRNTRKYKNNNKELYYMNIAAKTIIMYVLIVMLFSNHVQDMEAMIFVFMYLGMIDGINKNQSIEQLGVD